MKHLIDSVLNWFKHAEARQLERYLAESANNADLERRMRECEKSAARNAWRPYY
jgi:hypothetical protein